MPNSNKPRIVNTSESKTFNSTQGNYLTDVKTIAKSFIDKHQTNYRIP